MLLRSSVAVLRETRLELLLHSSEPEQLFRTSSHTKQHLENVMSYHFFGRVIWAMPKIDLFHSDFSYVYINGMRRRWSGKLFWNPIDVAPE